MRSIADSDTVQIDVTSACINNCSNCTHLVGHHKKNFFMPLEDFKKAVDSLVDFPHRIGIIGGEPLLHPDFQEMCVYLNSKVDKMRCGLWTCLPENKKNYRWAIVETFAAVYLNDHSKGGILHTPVLVASDEVMEDKELMWYFIIL